MNTTANSSFFKSSNRKAYFETKRNSENIISQTTATRKMTKNFGFRNHSLALGSTVRHFKTMSDFPKISSKVDRARSNMNPKECQKETIQQVPLMMNSLKNDPKALSMFIEELALADQSQPKHLRFLSDLPDTTTIGGIGLGSGITSPRIRRKENRKDDFHFALNNAANMFNEMFDSKNN